MKRHKIKHRLRNFINKLGQVEDGPDSVIAGYALFNTEKRAFISINEDAYEPVDTYTGDLVDAFIANDFGDAFGAMMGLEYAGHIIIVPVLHNELFGKTVKPGALDSTEIKMIDVYDEKDEKC